MKIFSAQQMRLADQGTIQLEKIDTNQLMERAGSKIFELIHHRLQGSPMVLHVFCGLGNNGGDGLVISRLLLEHGYDVKTYIVNFSDKRSKDFLINYDRLKEIATEWPIQLKSEEDFPTISQQDMVIDAIFGIGLNRPMESWVASLIKHINNMRSFTLAIDVPSGLYADKAPDDPDAVIFADTTLTFQLPKLIFFLPQTGGYSRDVEIIDIGLNPGVIQQIPGVADLIGKNEVLPLYRSRFKFSHKGMYGHSLLVGGSYGKIGSVVLATKATLKVGGGLATANIPECGYDTLQTAVPEAMVITDDDDELSEIARNFEPSAVGIGIGLGTSSKTIKAFGEFLKENKAPLVIDADAINILAETPDFLDMLPAQTILTPHPKELERLLGKWKDDFDKLDKAKEFSKKYDSILVIKGANSITVYKDQLYINNSGNPGMATAGSGDVLTGMITGLVSQGYAPVHACVFGVYLHGRAGDIASQREGFEAVIASSIVDNIGNAYLDLFKQPEPPVQNS